jgi:hypothetical protein
MASKLNPYISFKDNARETFRRRHHHHAARQSSLGRQVRYARRQIWHPVDGQCRRT